MTSKKQNLSFMGKYAACLIALCLLGEESFALDPETALDTDHEKSKGVEGPYRLRRSFATRRESSLQKNMRRLAEEANVPSSATSTSASKSLSPQEEEDLLARGFNDPKAFLTLLTHYAHPFLKKYPSQLTASDVLEGDSPYFNIIYTNEANEAKIFMQISFLASCSEDDSKTMGDLNSKLTVPLFLATYTGIESDNYFLRTFYSLIDGLTESTSPQIFVRPNEESRLAIIRRSLQNDAIKILYFPKAMQ